MQALLNVSPADFKEGLTLALCAQILHNNVQRIDEPDMTFCEKYANFLHIVETAVKSSICPTSDRMLFTQGLTHLMDAVGIVASDFKSGNWDDILIIVIKRLGYYNELIQKSREALTTVTNILKEQNRKRKKKQKKAVKKGRK
jgi:hypothetical protein